MPTCPKCGSPRIDRYCAKCGAAAVDVPDERGYVPRTDYVDRGTPAARVKRNRTPLMFVVFTCLFILGGIASLAFFTFHASVPVASSRFPADPQMDQLLRDFELQAGGRISDAENSLNQFATTSVIEQRLSEARGEFSRVSGIHVRLGSALRQARLEARWPVKVDGVSFRTPQQLANAMGSCDVYLRKAAAAEQELGRALDQNKRLQSDANGIVDEMKHIRSKAETLSTPDRTALRVDQQQLQSLSDELQNKLRNWTDVDWERANLSSFDLRSPQ